MSSQIKFKELLKAMQLIEDDRKIDQDTVVSALKEAIAKAYRKHVDIPDVQVLVLIDEKKGTIKAMHQKTVVEEVEDDFLEISLQAAKAIDPNVELGSTVSTDEVNITEFGRAAALLAKNVMKQKIREAEKQSVYDEYIDMIDEMMTGLIESVEERFVVVNLGKTLALMPKSAQIPGEYYREGEKIKVIITECNKETKGAQVLVSRSEASLVKRLFEKEVPEIFEGIVEIKAIARDAGERTKMAVYSKNSEVDPIGACIGPRGSRVQVVIEELKGEKIDIFEWSDNLADLIKNALAPATILAVFKTDDAKGITVVVEDNQLSLAIGKKGKNARLAVKLCGTKIDIKTRSEIEELGIDMEAKVFEFMALQEKIRREKVQAKLDEIKDELEVVEDIVEDTTSTIEEVIQEDVVETVTEESLDETVEDYVEPVEEIVKVEEVKEVEKEVVEVEKPVKVKKELKPRSEYVSKFERLAEVSKPVVEKKKDHRRKNKEEEERRLRAKDLKKDKDYEIKIEYSEEELEEIKRLEDMENSKWDDYLDYDDYDEYYDEEM